MNTLASELTEQFYLWERRGRGWQVWDHPVQLEPPFIPFSFIQTPARPQIDDGRQHTLLSGLVESVKKGFGRGNGRMVTEESADSEYRELLEAEPLPFKDESPIREIQITIPAEQEVTVEQTERFLLALSLCQFPVSFEIIGKPESISVQLACREADLPQVEAGVRAYFPVVAVKRTKDSMREFGTAPAVLIVDFGLSEEFMRPIRLFQYLEPDPLAGLISALEELRSGELGLFQVLFQATREPWTASILRSVSDGQGGSFFADAPEMIHLAREKTQRPLFSCTIRAMGGSTSEERTWDIVRRIASSLLPVTSAPLSNELIPLINDGYDDEFHISDVLLRQSHRSGMLLSSRELVTLVHPPSGSMHAEKLHRFAQKTRRVPTTAVGHGFILGENIHHAEITTVSLSVGQRLRHVHGVGATGTGKSTALLNLIAQDVEQGTGCAVIDPHGDLIDSVMGFIPGERWNDVVLFDPADSENPVGVNILSARSEAEKNVATSDLISVFRRLSSSWGDQMTAVLGNAIQAFLESERQGTLVELRRFLLEEEFRNKFLQTVRDAEVKYFWEKEYPLLKGNALASILTRLDTFLRPKLVRRVVAPGVELNFEEIINNRKILLVKLAHGLIGEENSSLLGTLLVSKLHQAAMARQAKAAAEREPFFLYIDEFQNFITPSLAGVLSGTRKYGLGLVLAHQELRQIWDQDTGVAHSLLANPATRICFRLGDSDAQKLQEGFVHFTAQDLQNLGVGEAIVRVDKAEDDFNLRIFPPKAVGSNISEERRRRIIELSHIIPAKPEAGAEEETPMPAPTVEGVVEKSPVEALVGKMTSKELETPIIAKKEPRVQKNVPIPSSPVEEKTLSQHRYLQALIKRMAEDRGFRAVIEEPTPDGLGRIDVGLEQNGKKIACEVSVTTDEEQEFHNIGKCLSAGYDQIIVCATDRKKLDKIKAYASQKLGSSHQEKILYFEPEALFVYLDEQVAQQTVKEERVKGYRVKVQYEPMNESERIKKRESVAQVVLKSMRKFKGDR